jgi:hypothetical protein
VVVSGNGVEEIFARKEVVERDILVLVDWV